MKKKGMGVGQVFIYIISGLTFALIMIFGYKAINSFLISGEQVEFIEFKNELESSVKKIYSEFGAVRELTFYPPSSYERICFVNMDKEPLDGEMDDLCKKSSAACDTWKDVQNLDDGIDRLESVDENVFLVPTAPHKIKVFRITIFNITSNEQMGFWCSPIDEGSFSIVLEGKGDHTEISPAE